jgi:alpha-N-acetylglucosaminidase
MRVLHLVWPAALALLATCAPALANAVAIGPSPVVAEPNGTQAVLALVRRRLPAHLHDAFLFTHDPSLAPNASAVDAFVVAQAPHGKVAVRGASTSALTRGLLTYLRTLGGDIYWSSDTFSSLPHTLPPLRAPLSGMSWAENRYLFNQVTYSYSLAFASWADWDYLLDWAALHGITLPLAVGGQEYVWRAVYRDFGLADADIYEWFSGPAFESWQRMGNIHGSWGSAGTRAPVTAHWIDSQWTLQRKIVNRMVALGMTPVLPGFAGFIPPALHARLGGPGPLVASEWSGFPPAFTNDVRVRIHASWAQLTVFAL